MGKVIASHTAKVIKDSLPAQNNQQKFCNCLVKEECPMDGQCLKKELIYQATVISEGQQTQNYVGLTANTFKDRYSGHLHNFKNENSKGTTLSSYIWKLKNESKTYKINWKILKHAKPFSPVNGQCALCTTEKKFIIFKPELSSLNTRNELGAHCRHKKSRLLFKKLRAKEKT